MTAFLVERDWKGVTTRDTENKLGIWAGSTGELFFEDVEVPAANLIGEEGQGFEIAMYGLDQGRFTVAAGACGVVRACLERSVEYARERETFGKAIGTYQATTDWIYVLLVVVGIVMALVSVVYYLGVAREMFVGRSDKDNLPLYVPTATKVVALTTALGTIATVILVVSF